MPLENYALASLAELKAYMGNLTGSTFDENLNQALNEATALIEGRLSRELASRGEFTEFHSLGPHDGFVDLFLGEWPVVSVTSVHEDDAWPRAYGVDKLLTEAEDFEVAKADGYLRRLGAGGGPPICWRTGSRIVRVVYSAGYRGIDGQPAAARPVPYDLKNACLFAAASLAKETERQRWGVSAVTDGLGTVTRYLGLFTPEIEKQLSRYQRREHHRTWEKAA